MSAVTTLLEVGGRTVEVGSKATKAAQKISISELGYDFVGLTLKLTVFFVVAGIIGKLVEASLGLNLFWSSVLNLVGAKTLNHIPLSVSKLFKEGYNGITYWDIVKFLSILLVTFEALQYYKQNGKAASPMTGGLFALFLSGLILITLPEFMQKMKEHAILSKVDVSKVIIPTIGTADFWINYGFNLGLLKEADLIRDGYTKGSDGKWRK